jgi:hypothetical protein
MSASKYFGPLGHQRRPFAHRPQLKCYAIDDEGSLANDSRTYVVSDILVGLYLCAKSGGRTPVHSFRTANASLPVQKNVDSRCPLHIGNSSAASM